MPLQDYQLQVEDLVRDDAGQLLPESTGRAIATAVARLSSELARTQTAELTNQSGNKLATPAGWVPGESRLDAIEYPVGEVPPVYLEATRVMVLEEIDGTEVIGLADPLPAASTIRVRFTLPHEVTGQADTVPEAQKWGVVCMAASILAGQLASWYANQSNSTIQADAVEHRSKSELWAAREKRYEQQAFGAWGLPVPSGNGGGDVQSGSPAGVIKSFEPRRGWRSVWW